MIYLIVLLLLLLFSIHYDINGETKNKDFWYNMMLVVFILIAGLRWRLGVDTPNYLGFFYHKYPTLDHFSFEEYGIFQSPFYVLINSFVKSIGGKFFIVQLIHATIVNALIFKYIKRHSSYIFTCLFFYSFICYTTYNMETMRASISIAICLFANDYILDKKWWRGYLLYLLALMFHPQTLVMFILPLLFFLKFDKKGIIALFIALLIGKVLAGMLQDYMFLFEGDDAIENRLSNYSDSEKYGTQSGNLNFYIMQIILPIIYLVCSLLYIKKSDSKSDLLKLEPFLMIGLVFVMIRANFEIAYRYVDSFEIYFILFYSDLLVKLVIDVKRIDKVVAYMRSFVILFPIFFLFLIHTYALGKGKGYRYIPYNSVFERKINKKQQLKYNKVQSTKYPYVNREEY